LPVKAVFFLYLCSLARNGSSPQGCLPATEQRKLLLVPEGRRVRLPVATECPKGVESGYPWRRSGVSRS